jgi:hypothetical protein
MRHTDLQRKGRKSTAELRLSLSEEQALRSSTSGTITQCGYQRLLNKWLYARFSS